MSNTRKLTYSALLLALAVGFQTGGRALMGTGPSSLFVVGSLVNLVLIVAVGYVGLWPAIAVAVLTPVMALLQGHITIPIQVPIVAFGNIIFPLVYWIFAVELKTLSKIFSVILGSILKCGFLWLTMPYVMINLILPTMDLPAAKLGVMVEMISFNFSWPQCVTALIGGIIAIIVLRALPKREKEA